MVNLMIILYILFIISFSKADYETCKRVKKAYFIHSGIYGLLAISITISLIIK